MPSKPKEYCKNGHLMAESRKYSPKAGPYCSVCKTLYFKHYARRNKGQVKETNWKTKLKNQFRLTPQQYIDMYIFQNGKCTICQLYIEYRGFFTHVDHCHDKGNVRSLLCSNCNTALGLLKENIEVMHRAIAYVDKHKNTSINKE
jgi:hypothetical protein